MSPATDPRRGRLLAVLVLLIVLLGGYLLFVHWWFTAPFLAARAELIELRDQEARLRAAGQQRPLIEQKLAEVQAFEAQNPGFLPEANFDLAAASLSRRLQELVDAQNAGADCTIVSRSHVRERESEPFLRVTVQAALRCEMEHLAAVLHGLESGSPQLFVADMNFNARRNIIARPGQAAPRGHIDVRFSFYGYLQQSGETP